MSQRTLYNLIGGVIIVILLILWSVLDTRPERCREAGGVWAPTVQDGPWMCHNDSGGLIQL